MWQDNLRRVGGTSRLCPFAIVEQPTSEASRAENVINWASPLAAERKGARKSVLDSSHRHEGPSMMDF
jgi:hypothetical protein